MWVWNLASNVSTTSGVQNIFFNSPIFVLNYAEKTLMVEYSRSIFVKNYWIELVFEKKICYQIEDVNWIGYPESPKVIKRSSKVVPDSRVKKFASVLLSFFNKNILNLKLFCWNVEWRWNPVWTFNEKYQQTMEWLYMICSGYVDGCWGVSN